MDYCKKRIRDFAIRISDYESISNAFKIYPKFKWIWLEIFNGLYLSKKEISFLRKKNIKLQVRSIFLRGLLLHDYNTLPRKFNYWKDNFKKYQMYLKKNRLSKTLGALSILNKIDFTSVVIGFDKYQELKDVVKNLPNNKLLIPKFNIKKINKIIDPRKW